MRKRLLAAGFPSEDMQILAPPEAPNDGALVAVLRGKDRLAKPILLLAHIDVVEAKREDWQRDPFTLVEESGWFYARGASDDKAMAAILTDGNFFNPAGVPTYGLSGLFEDAEGNHIHGLNEPMSVKSLMDGRRVPLRSHQAVRER